MAAIIAPDDLAACRRALHAGSHSFAAATRLLPPRLRAPVTALYAFCRDADDTVDSGGGPPALAALHGRLDAIYAGRPGIPVDRAFAAAVHRFALPRTLPEALLEGLAWDIEGRCYEDLPALVAYAMRVAGSVGVMMTLLMGERRPDMLGAAADLGCAMQLTNIARDVGEDARAGRVYLPIGWLREAGLDPSSWLASPRMPPPLAAVVRRLLDAAETHYRRAEPAIARLPFACRPAIRAARLLYGAIGDEVARRGCDSVTSRAVVSPSRKLLLLSRCLPRPGGLRLHQPVVAPPSEASNFLLCGVSSPAISESRPLRTARNTKNTEPPVACGGLLIPDARKDRQTA